MVDPQKIPSLVGLTHLGSITPLPKEILERIFERPQQNAIVGNNFEIGETIAIGDEERCGGFYILGKPRTGNTPPPSKSETPAQLNSIKKSDKDEDGGPPPAST